MKTNSVNPWWGGAARNRLDPAIARQARQWQAQKHAPEVQQFDFYSRIKVGLLFLGFVAVMALVFFIPNQPIVNTLAVLLLGLFVIPYTRIFMHSQMHWGMGGNRVTRFLLDHFGSLIFSVPQTSYAVGHRMHHRHDNDLATGGRVKDLQSTYIFSRNGKPSRMFLWIPYYMFVFQHLVAPWLVLGHGKNSEKAWYLLELAVLIGFHVALYHFFARFYLPVYLPALLLAWFASAMVLYMMHAVEADNYVLHPTNTSLSRFFNAFGDNDGYHLEHTLFSSVHPLYLPRLHALIAPHASQVFDDHYFIAGLKYAFSGSWPASRTGDGGKPLQSENKTAAIDSSIHSM